jgi:hypothetical protein
VRPEQQVENKPQGILLSKLEQHRDLTSGKGQLGFDIDRSQPGGHHTRRKMHQPFHDQHLDNQPFRELSLLLAVLLSEQVSLQPKTHK